MNTQELNDRHKALSAFCEPYKFGPGPRPGRNTNGYPCRTHRNDKTLYILGCFGDDQTIIAVKFGIVDQKTPLAARVKSLQTGCPFRLGFLAAIDPADFGFERSIHRRFREFNMSGEWFRYAGGCRAFVNDVILWNQQFGVTELRGF